MQQIFKGKQYADYYQFYLQSSDSTQNQEDICIPENFEKMLGVGDKMIVINTTRYDDVRVRVTVFKKAPKLNLDKTDRANECSLLITNILQLGSVISGFKDFGIPLSIYRVRILYKNLNSPRETFHIQLWQEAEMRETVYSVKK
jgi:hypothetical protein